ncbi:MAG: RimK/LysX family protein [Bacteroidota bacterium]|nr:RimK/LysX family protein [Bacteroidota bacterium]
MARIKKIIGRTDIVDLPEFGIKEIKVKIDTGAYTSAIHCSKIKTTIEDGEEYVTFHILNSHIKGTSKKRFKTNDFKQKNIKSSSGHIEKRYVIKTRILLFNKLINTEFSLTDRSQMKYPILLGRKLLSKRFIVDVTSFNLSFKNKKHKL